MNMGAEQQATVKGAGGGSRFAAACGLLRQYQYMMGQGRGAAAMKTMGLNLMPGADGVEAAAVTPEERIKTTIELLLFPQRPGTFNDTSHQRSTLEAERGQPQLTIFYDGKTTVFDDFPADKADQLMQLAGSILTSAATSYDEPVCHNEPPYNFMADMPIARKASLQRFLEKRKTRLAAADPYPVGAAKETGGKPAGDGGAPWLGVNTGLHLN